jgi:ADP-heptose:LPS heptosyltransferase
VKLTVTYPAKMGDCLWSLAAIRRVSQLQSVQVNMVVSRYLAPLVPLLKAQPYIESAWADMNWEVEFSAPVRPRTPPVMEGFIGPILHLGMSEWPRPTLIGDHARRAGVSVNPWELWITPLSTVAQIPSREIGIHLSDEWAELKAGLIGALLQTFPNEKFVLLTHPAARIAQEWRFPFRNVHTVYSGISGLSDWLSGLKLLVTCKSFARVMALGMGIPTVVVEPSVPRHNPVFDPPTPFWREIIQNGFDARELVQNVRTMLERTK